MGVMAQTLITDELVPVAPVAAKPRTKAQRERYDRVLDEAERTLLTAGEDALQMKDLADRAGVALATLYRYFPSKRHLIIAVLAYRYQQIEPKLRPAENLDVRHRLADYLIRVYRAQNRVADFTRAVQRALFQAGPEFAELAAEAREQYQLNAEKSAGTMSDVQRRILPSVLSMAASITSDAIATAAPETDVHARIYTACRMLDFSEDDLADDERAGREWTADRD